MPRDCTAPPEQRGPDTMDSPSKRELGSNTNSHKKQVGRMTTKKKLTKVRNTADPRKPQGPKGMRVPMTTSSLNYATPADAGRLADLVSAGSITQDGQDWLVAALDPFHDNARNLAGYPDVDSSKTTVASYSYTTEISSVLPDWQAHVFTLPITSASAAFNGSMTLHHGTVTQTVPTYAGGYYTLGPINIIVTDPTADAFPTSAAWNPAGAVVSNWPEPASALNKGYSRVIACGYEIINTTSKLAQCGGATTYRMPANPTPTSVRAVDATAGNLVEGTTTFQAIRCPPATVAQAMQLRGSCEWEASKGVYAPVTMGGMANPLKATSNSPYLLVDQPDNASTFCIQQKMIGAAAVTNPQFWENKVNNQDIVGTFITGQKGPTSTFKVKYTVVVETAPSYKEFEACAYSSPSAQYDPEVLKLYSRLVAYLPVATISANNANGDWFKAILKMIHVIARPIAGLFGDKYKKGADNVYGEVRKVVNVASELFPLLP